MWLVVSRTLSRTGALHFPLGAERLVSAWCPSPAEPCAPFPTPCDEALPAVRRHSAEQGAGSVEERNLFVDSSKKGSRRQ